MENPKRTASFLETENNSQDKTRHMHSPVGVYTCINISRLEVTGSNIDKTKSRYLRANLYSSKEQRCVLQLYFP